MYGDERIQRIKDVVDRGITLRPSSYHSTEQKPPPKPAKKK